MAYQYDEMGNVIGEFETEEERRQREEAAKQLTHKVEVKTYGDGRQTQTTTQELPAPGPVSPDTFARMQQAESGNRDYYPNGQPVVSPAGAMFRNQVMPSTAAQPGYGIRPAASQTPEEYNRVGQEYYQAMLKKFGGNEQAAAAAYNAGPGTVERNMAANQGQLNISQLPQETQGYLGKIGQAVTNMFPSAQAGTLPPGQAQQAPTITPVAPQTQPAINPETGETYQQLMPVAPGQQPAAQPAPIEQPSPYSLSMGQTGLGMRGPGGITANGPAVTGVPMTTTSAMNTYEAAQDNVAELIKMRHDPNMPDFIRQRAGQRAYEIMDKEFKDKQFQDSLKQLSNDFKNPETARQAGNTLARELQNKDASPFKYWFFKLIGQPEAAAEEAVKLGMGSKWIQGFNDEGKPAMIKVDARGLPQQGFDDSGNEIASNKLVSYMIGGKAAKSDVSTQDVEKNGQAGRVVTQHLPNGQTKTMVESGGKLYPYDTSWKPRSIQTAYDKRQQELNLKLQYVGPEAVAKIVAEDEAKNGPLDPQVKAAILQRATTAAPQVGATAPTTGTADRVKQQLEGGGGAGLPSATPAATAAPAGQYPGQRATEREISESGRKEILKKAGDIVASSDKLVTEITKADRAAQDVLTQKNNFGTLIHGMIPGEQAVGEIFKTQDHINTMNVLDVVNKIAASNAKMLGANPTDRDLQFVTATKPDINWSPEAVADWLRRSSEGTRRTLDFARKQVETGGKFVPETPKEEPASTKKLSREDQRAIEWVRKNPDDPRAAEIKRRLGL